MLVEEKQPFGSVWFNFKIHLIQLLRKEIRMKGSRVNNKLDNENVSAGKQQYTEENDKFVFCVFERMHE